MSASKRLVTETRGEIQSKPVAATDAIHAAAVALVLMGAAYDVTCLLPIPSSDTIPISRPTLRAGILSSTKYLLPVACLGTLSPTSPIIQTDQLLSYEHILELGLVL